MEETATEIYEMFKREYLTIIIPQNIKVIVVCEMRKYVEALELENEYMGGDSEIINDISESKNLLLKLVLTKDHEKVEMTIAEFLVLSGMLYCSMPLVETGFYSKLDSRIVNEYKNLYNSIDELYRMLDEKHIDEYKKFVKFKDDSFAMRWYRM